MFLLLLPADCLVEIVSEWLKIENIGVLDTALTNNTWRQHFVHTLQLGYCILPGKQYVRDSRYYHWLQKNDFQVDTIYFTSNFFKILSNQKSFRYLYVRGAAEVRTPLIEFCASCRYLTSLNLSSAEPDTILTNIISMLPCGELLKDVVIQLSLINNMNLSTIIKLSVYCKNLETLLVPDIYIDCVVPEDACFPKLLEFELTNSVVYDTIACSWITRRSPLLKNFKTGRRIEPYNTFEVNDLFGNCQNLESLELTIVDSQQLVDVITTNKKLKALDVESESNFDNLLRTISKHCPQFRKLRLACGDVNENVLIDFVREFPNLEYFCLSTLTSHVTTQFIDAITTSCVNIKAIELLEEPLLIDEDITKICRSCKLLESLTVDESPLLTDISLLSIAMWCHNLTSLDIWIDNCTEVGWKHLANGCAKLSTMNLNGDGRARLSECKEYLKVSRPSLFVYY